MLSWSLDKDRRIYPPHYRRAHNFSIALSHFCEENSLLTEYSVSDLLIDRIKTYEHFLKIKRNKQPLLAKIHETDIETASSTIISFMAIAPLVSTLLLLVEDADKLSRTFECSLIINSEDRIFGKSLGANQLISEYVFHD